jgi:hypothetical protein
MSLPTMATLQGLSFPRGITTVGIEFEGYWEREDRLWAEEHDPADCEGCTWHADYGEWDYCSDFLNSDDNWESDDRERRRLNLKHDGSVWCDDDGDIPNADYIAGEKDSPILTRWTDVLRFAASYLPDAVDAKTGMHVHMGVTESLLEFSCHPLYWNHLRTTLQEIGSHCSAQTQAWLESRLRTGKSDRDQGTAYCRPNTDRPGDRENRYRMANYTAYESHGTLEIRVCPMAEGYTKADCERQTLALIYGVLQATSDYWTSKTYWQQAVGHINAVDDLTLLTSELTTADPIEHTVIL